MKKFLVLMFFLLINTSIVSAEVLHAGVSIENVPKALYGNWRVNAKLDTTNAPSRFRPQSIDFWDLSRIGNVVKLDNPFSGANAEISLKTVEGNAVVFSKQQAYDGNKLLTDTVTLRLGENEFSGINTLKLETFSQIDQSILKTETATYHIKGEKLSGDSISIEENSVIK